MAHTPGPWRAQPIGIGYKVIERIRCDHPTHQHIADVKPRPDETCGSWVSPRSILEQEANARLISAAPDLLAIAIQAESDLKDKLAYCAGGDEIQIAAIERKLEAARAALAKATAS